MLSTFRAMLCIVAPNVTSRFKRRPIYLACCAIVCMGTLTLSSYCYFNQNNQLVNQFPVTRWIPILAIVICYTGFSFGYGSVVYILQVNSKNIFWTITPLIKLCSVHYLVLTSLISTIIFPFSRGSFYQHMLDHWDVVCLESWIT